MLVPILHRLAPERDCSPSITFPIEPYRVVRLLDVRAIANGHEALQVEGHLLASDADLELAVGQRADVRDECHPEVPGILVDGRDHLLPERTDVFELRK